ncbi:hypothetical protein PG637_08845 [Riemerella anatipestifer]|nr:hypothetical protein [Riemerella anatipestifer]MDY3325770.1 hypothetical protein [Riemerella anatipestifer]MDY3354312.1 hypothetical protein [Riemerella anatipestifer]
MKKVIFSTMIFLSVTISAQEKIESIKNNETHLLINDSITIKKGSNIKIYLPAGKDFVFVKQKKNKLSAKLIGNIAGVVGTGASAIGIGTSNVEVLDKAIKVMNTARAVQYGADAIERVKDLPISDNAKKIAGKEMLVLDWTFTDDGWVVNTEYNKKKYEIYLQEALMAGEVRLKN